MEGALEQGQEAGSQHVQGRVEIGRRYLSHDRSKHQGDFNGDWSEIETPEAAAAIGLAFEKAREEKSYGWIEPYFHEVE